MPRASRSRPRSRRLTPASRSTTTRRFSSPFARRPKPWRSRNACRRPAPQGKPLHGVPFVVKDNIDVAGLPTTAACPAFAYRPTKSAFVVERLERAGAIVIGKTNLDQFATGLVGVRSPYGVPRNALRADLIPGGSSSGSATAVGAGLVPFSLGTDTAGSGRVPAALNGIVGLKPSLGALSTSGVVPACRTLDTISIFARDVADAFLVYQEACAFDEADAYSRAFPRPALSAFPSGFRLGVPRADQRQFFDDAEFVSGFFARHSARRIARRPDRRVRLRAVRRGRPGALRRSMGRRAIRRDEVADREQSGGSASRHPHDYRGRAQVRRGRRLRGLLSARRSEAEDQPRLVRIRRDGRSDHAAPLHGRRGRGRSDPAQFPAWDLHQLRQSARPLRDRRSLGRSRRRTAVERDPDRARRRRRPHRRRGRCDPRPFRRFDDQRSRCASRAAGDLANNGRPHRDRGRRRASLGPAAQSRTRRAWRGLLARSGNDAGLPSLRAARLFSAKARTVADRRERRRRRQS